jgi:hypothetical protein
MGPGGARAPGLRAEGRMRRRVPAQAAHGELPLLGPAGRRGLHGRLDGPGLGAPGPGGCQVRAER